MKTHVLSVIFLSFALIAGCNDGGSETGGDGGGPNLTTSVTFDFSDFTGVSVGGPFSVSIVPGPYSIRVTVDSGLHRLLDVHEEGQLLIVGFEPGHDIDSQIMDVEIVMPTLERVDLAGLTSGSISGFNDALLNIHLAGTASLEAQNVSYDFLMVNAAGLSFLTMEDITPLPAANLHLAGASSATVNMMDNAVLTGTVEGKSTLSYYGNNVSIGDVFVDADSLIKRLGPSRP